MTARRHPHPNPLPSRAREGICGVLPLKEKEKERGFIRGNSFPLILRKVFPSSTLERFFSSVIDLIFFHLFCFRL